MNGHKTVLEKGNVARIVDRLSKDITVSNPAHLDSNLEVSLRKCPTNLRNRLVVRFSYTAQQPDELSLNEGDELEFIEKSEDGWARGIITQSSDSMVVGKIGLYPTNFTSELEFSSSDKSAEAEFQRSNTSQPNVKKENEGIVHTNNVLPSSIKTSRRVMSTIISSSNGEASLHSTMNKDKNKDYAKVMFKYDAANPDEIDLPEGAIVTILNRKCDDEGWYFGEFNGKRGLFPENFVKIMEHTHEPERPPSPVISLPTIPSKPSKFITITNQTAYTPVPKFENIAKRTAKESVNSQSSNSSDAEFSVKPKEEDRQIVEPYPIAKSAPNSIQEERKSLVFSLQNKLFSSGKMPFQRPPPQQKRRPSPENIESVFEPKVSFGDPTTAKLPSLVKSRAVLPSKRPPSKINTIVSTEGDSSAHNSETPCLNHKKEDLSCQNIQKTEEVELTENTTTKSATSLPEKDDSALKPVPIAIDESKKSVVSEEKYVTREEYNKYQEEVNRKFGELSTKIEFLTRFNGTK